MPRRHRLEEYRCSHCKTEWYTDWWHAFLLCEPAATCPECGKWGTKLKRRHR